MFNLLKKKEPINIFYGVDDNYTDYLIVAMTSVILSADRSDILHFYIMHCIFNLELDGDKLVKTNVGEKFLNDLEQLKKMAKDRKIEIKIELIPINPELVNGLKGVCHVTQTAYFKCLIPLFKPELDKCLYLDVDTIVLNSLSDFYKIDLKNTYCAVTEDMATGELLKSQLEYTKTKKYFNSGVMLINLKKWNEESIATKLLENAYNSTFADQPVLNFIFKENVTWFEKKYNCCINSPTHLLNINDITIIHFAGIKPWINNHPQNEYFELYDKIVKKSPIKNLNMRDWILKKFRVFYGN